jgi:hypothetical protein
MRFFYRTTKPQLEIVVGYKHLVAGFIHQRFPADLDAKNELHDKLSLYSVSNLEGSKLDFPRERRFS